jgi:hypothetical protein
MPASAELFETMFWVGRFTQALAPRPVVRLGRREIKLAICGVVRATDANIRAALIDLWGGKERAIGRKALTGPLYGVHADIWSALAVAVAWSEGARSK